MVPFIKHVLNNGLRLVVHRDQTTPMAVLNILYDVGARDENPAKTGFAHLFEHLMFEGSVNVSDFDLRLQLAGGENNAFTTNDFTNYFMTLPAVNIETAFWLESDRMLGLAFSEERLRVQKNVVTEEYRQSYLNQPYGDTMLLIRSLCYQVHPYQWATIGKNIEHIQTAGLDEVRVFFEKYYHPGNAILCVSSPYDEQVIIELADKWFGDISAGKCFLRSLPAEPEQAEQRRLVVERDVPASQLYMVFHTCGRNDPRFFVTDMLNDILANGDSSRLKQRLVKQKKLFSQIDAYISGSLDTGMFVVTGKLHPETDMEKAEQAVWEELHDLAEHQVGATELQKVRNKIEATHLFSESNLVARTMNLAYYELLGDAELINTQIDQYFNVTAETIRELASTLFRPERSSVMHYLRQPGNIKATLPEL